MIQYSQLKQFFMHNQLKCNGDMKIGWYNEHVLVLLVLLHYMHKKVKFKNFS